MPKTRSLRTPVFAICGLIFAACIAALVAHFGIDLAGDFVLDHDSYDGIDHGSRIGVGMFAVCLAGSGALAAIRNAVVQARSGRAARRATFERTFGLTPWRFVGLVILAALPLLMTMELLDLVLRGNRIDALGDLLGGSFVLGIGITTPVAACVALAIRYVADLLLNAQPLLVAALTRILAELARVDEERHCGLRLRRCDMLPASGPTPRGLRALSRERCSRRFPRQMTIVFRLALARRALLTGTLAMCAAGAGASAAQPQIVSAGAIEGNVIASDGSPIRGAVIVLRGGGMVRTGRTDTTGHFTVTPIRAGTYAVRVTAVGYDDLGPRTIGVGQFQTTELSLALVRSPSSLATIGHVFAGGGEALSTSCAPVTTLNSQTYAAQGYTRISDVLQDDISTTLVHPLGGGSTVLPTSVALRGPDPTETLVDIDGHQVNSGNTGDFDLSLLDPADYSSIELVKGIAPSSLVGPDTIDGAINIRTLEPTSAAHGLLRLSAGSFNSFASTLQATGTQGRLGYAFSFHRTTTAGAVNQPIFDATAAAPAQVGSGVDGSSALGKLRYAFGAGGDGYAELSIHDQSIFRDESAALSSYPVPERSAISAASPLAVLNAFEGTTLQAHNAGYGLDVKAPLGAPDASDSARMSLLFRHYTSLVAQSVAGPGAQTSPYLYNDRDLISDDSLQFERRFSNGTFTAQYAVRNESLVTDLAAGVVNDQSIVRARAQPAAALRTPFDNASVSLAPTVTQLLLAQTQRSAVVRYAYDATPALHLTLATYYSDYSLFGHSLDPRIGAVFTPNARWSIHASAGTTYQAPQLPELFVPATLPAAVGNYVSVGNPNLRPDHATEFGLGFAHVLAAGAHATDVSADLYRVNLRTPAAKYLPPLDPNCGAPAGGGDGTLCPLSYPVNAGDAIYQGVELSAQHRIARYATINAGYAVRSAFLTKIPPAIQDGSLVVNEQTAGLPLHKATLALTASPPRGLTFRATLAYEGRYNELNEPPFATVDASVGYRWHSFEVTLAGTNLTDVYDARFTRSGLGIQYGGLTGPLATDAYALDPVAFKLNISRRF